MAIAQDVQAHQRSDIQGIAGGRRRILLRDVVLQAIAKEQFIAINFLIGSENGLAGHDVRAALAWGARLSRLMRR